MVLALLTLAGLWLLVALISAGACIAAARGDAQVSAAVAAAHDAHWSPLHR